MIKPVVFALSAVVAANFLGACSKSSSPAPAADNRELSASECVQLEKKMGELFKLQMEKEFPGTSWQDGQYKMDPACSSLKEKGRLQFTCAMSASSLEAMQQCMAGGG